MIPSPQTLPTTAPAMAPSETRLEVATAVVDAEAVDDDDAAAVAAVDSVVEVGDKISLELSGVHMSML